MCITGVGCNNYKSFKDIELEFKPITILTGNNGVGKTNLMCLFLLLKHGMMQRNYNHSLFSFKGMRDSVRVSDVKNLFPNNNTKVPIDLSYTFRKQNNFNNVIHEVLVDIQSALKPHYLEMEQTFTSRKKLTFPETIKTHDDLSAVFFNLRQWAQKYHREPMQYSITNPELISFLQKIYNWDEQFKDVLDLVKLLEGFQDNQNNILKFGYTFKSNRRRENKEDYQAVIIDDIYLMLDQKDLIRLKLEQQPNKRYIYTLSSEFDTDNVILKKYSDTLRKVIPQKLSLRQKKEKAAFNLVESDTFFIDILIRFMKQAFWVLEEYMMTPDKISFLPAERCTKVQSYPYPLGEKKELKYKTDGVKTIEILRKNLAIRNTVNKWLKKIDHKVEFHSGNLKIKYKTCPVRLDVKEASSGISVVLPILVRILSAPRDSISLIEHPELHLHPEMQIWLADFIISNFRKDSSVILETHSKVFLTRFRRMISEGELASNEVRSYNIVNEGGISRCELMDRSKNGFIISRNFNEKPEQDRDALLLNNLVLEVEV